MNVLPTLATPSYELADEITELQYKKVAETEGLIKSLDSLDEKIQQSLRAVLESFIVSLSERLGIEYQINPQEITQRVEEVLAAQSSQRQEYVDRLNHEFRKKVTQESLIPLEEIKKRPLLQAFKKAM